VALAGEERRVVTVLFADLVGFTTLAEHLDPEHVKRLVDACFELLIDDVTAFGGSVDKVLGDAIVALFGAPTAHEDDAERAVRAALRLHETLAAFVAHRDEVGEEQSEPIRLRVGINTGEVLVGSLVGTEYTAMGDVVNIASRLQAMAPPGSVLIGDATAALCSPAIRREPFARTQLRGREGIEQVWLATGASTRTRVKTLREDIPFVGRAGQRSLLTSTLELVLSGRSAVVAITGEAGIGKTRLVDEMLCQLPENSALLRGACAPYGETNAWWPLASALADRLELDVDLDGWELRHRALDRAASILDAEPDQPELKRFAETLAHLLGRPSELDRLDPTTARAAMIRTIVASVRLQAELVPTVLFIDDIQWADPVVLELLDLTARSLHDVPLLIITAQRPDDSINWPPGIERPLVVRLPLGPLERNDAEMLIGLALGHDPDPELVDRLVERAGGNPLFLTELASLEQATCDGRATLPGSLRALIAARLDEIPLSRRAVLDNAAVLGATGAMEGLKRFASEMGQRFDQADVAGLVRDGFLVTDDKHWRFRSDVVREVAYGTLTKYDRAMRHAGVAAVLVEDRRSSIDDLAHHAATAAELLHELGSVGRLAETISAEAVTFLADAARRALERGAFDQVVRHVDRAMALHQADPEITLDLMLLRATARTERRAAADAQPDLERVLDRAISLGDRRREAEARRLLGTLAYASGDLAGARRELGRAIELFRDGGDDQALANALRVRGFAEVFGGQLADAEWFLGEADSLYEKLGDERGRAWVRQHEAWVAFLAGDTDEAEKRLESAAATFADLGDRAGVSWANGLMAYVRYFQRRFPEAEALATEVEEQSRGWGEQWAPMMMQTLLANLRLWSGRFDEAERFAEKAVQGFRRIGDRFGAVQALAPLNRARVALGKFDEAERGIEEVLSMSDAYDEMGFPLIAAAGSAMHLGDPDRTVAFARQAGERALDTGAATNEIAAVMAVGLCQARRGDDALAAIDPIDVTDMPFGRAARALARAVTGDPAGALDDAGVAWTLDGVSYLDRTIAGIAAAGAAMSIDDRQDARDWLARVAEIAESSGDVVAARIARYGGYRLLGTPAAGDPSGLGRGWVAVIDQLARRS
jgi:class 3 adenylate cyclase/tetratricopeptide (TPR) repeat protein